MLTKTEISRTVICLVVYRGFYGWYGLFPGRSANRSELQGQVFASMPLSRVRRSILLSDLKATSNSFHYLNPATNSVFIHR